MKKRIIAGLTVSLLLLAACGRGDQTGQEDKLNILATTYPVYLFAQAVAEGVDGVEVTLLVSQSVSCLHDYTLTVNDMKAVQQADVLVMNGAGLESFMDAALGTATAEVIDCSAEIALLPYAGHDEHDHSEDEAEHYDPHFWMDPLRAATMVSNIGDRLAALDPDNGAQYQANTVGATTLLYAWDSNLRELLCTNPDTAPINRNLITFHDGFQYFAETFEFTLLKSIEEEEGSEASAMEIKEIVGLVGQYKIPVIFTEQNGSEATAQAISRECGVAVAQLTMLMSGEETALSAYLDAQMDNALAIINGFAGREVLYR